MTHAPKPRYNKCTLRVLLFCCGFAAAEAAAEATDTAEVKAAEVKAAEAVNSSLTQIAEVEKLAAATVPDQIAPDEVLHPRPALVNSSRVVQQRVVVQGGRTITTQLMEGPPPAKSSPSPVIKPSAKPAEPIERKPTFYLSLSNTVFDHTVTEMRWGKNQEYKVYVNIDFTLFRGVRHVEGENHIYALNLGIGEVSTEKENRKETLMQNSLSHLSLFATKDILFHPAKDNPPGITETREYKALPVLLEFYAANEHELRWKQAVQKAENDARHRWRVVNPETPKDTVIQFWPVQRPAK